jgi:hypothetical protein
MFVRFRRVRHRLIVQLIETRRLGGKVKSEHLATLGSAALPEPIEARERIRFWRELKERFRDLAARLGNRVTADDRRKALAAIHARIPKPTEADEQAVRIETARDDVRFWEQVRDDFSPGSKFNEPKRRLIETVEKQLADQRPSKEAAERLVASAQARFLKLTRGERVAGDDGPPAREEAAAAMAGWPGGLTRKQAAANAGMTPPQARRAINVARIPRELFEQMLEADPPASVTKLAAVGQSAGQTPE